MGVAKGAARAALAKAAEERGEAAQREAAQTLGDAGVLDGLAQAQARSRTAAGASAAGARGA